MLINAIAVLNDTLATLQLSSVNCAEKEIVLLKIMELIKQI